MEPLTVTRFFATEGEILDAFPQVSDLSIGFVALHSLICWHSDDAGLIVLGTATPTVAEGGAFRPIASTPNLGGWSGCGYWKLLAADADGYINGALAALYSPLDAASILSELREEDEWRLVGAVLFTGDARDRFLEAV